VGHPGADPSTIRENLQRAKQRREDALAELAAATRELEWWREGLAMFDPESAAAEAAEEMADAEIRQIVPDGYARNPTTRQIIVQAMRAEPAGEWPIARIFDLAVMHRWLAEDDQEQIKRITDMTALMTREGVLTRAGRGVYKLREDLVGALSRALHPITDYRAAARYGLPVPPRPPVRPRGIGRRAISSDVRTSQARE
jgi:hypothetical protein